jgi:alanyl aminopeptidase
MNGNAELYARYRAAYLKSESEDQKSTILYAMYFRDPAIVGEHLDFAISEAVPAGDAVSALSNFAYVLDDHAPVYAWLEKNLDALQAKVPEYMSPLLPLVMQSACDAHNLSLLKDFYGRRGEVYAASLTKAVETIEDCIGRKAREGAALEAFLAAY